MCRRPPLNIVIDTNVIVASLIRKGIVRELLVGHRGVFMTPESCIDEVWERRGAWNRRGVPDAEIAEALSWLTENIVAVMPRSVYRDREGEARALIADPDDVPVVALALSFDNDGTWTFNTKDFSRAELLARVRVLTTGDVRWLIEGSR